MQPIRLAHDTLQLQELENVARWLVSGQKITMGSLTARFEQAFAAYLGVEHATFVNSGSSANLLAIYALGSMQERKYDTIIAPAISWATTVAPAMQFGMKIHLCDCDQDDLGFDLNHFEDLAKRHGPGIAILVHVLGHPNKMAELSGICEKHGITLIEDTCEALGSGYRGRKVGTFGAASTFSFYYGHQMSTIEGGMVVAQDRALHNIIKSLRAHGWARDIDQNVKSSWEKEFDVDEFQSFYTFYHPGFNCRPTDLNAHLGLSQITRMESVVRIRERNYSRYRAALGSDYWVQSSEHDALCSFAFGTVVENRLEVYRHLRENGIETRPLICGSIGRQPFWTRRYGAAKLANADVVHEQGLYLPNHANLTEGEVDRVIAEFRKVAIPSLRKGWGAPAAGKSAD